ncbi:preprotein translocase subunit YajC [Salana multivorans]|uniref:Preprotein translocase subunit YajC n=1 Tax=Salana multivorans TaxID=120377 RepID=A0A3N2D1G9_9MICO|nr:preprotein translocase subunit YajC [Salana multivorans]MBN8883110.1 preprotein translocase subunit YajC [Salana multivorans]OJX94386.1 MAG: preprotein translocase subunit YajC [Micrococcales bacterium 73-15]ROR93615.1 preprotein translocase subunit YajC [Salana multivorans]
MDPLLLVFLGLAVVGLFFVSSRGRKQQAKQNEFRSSLTPGKQIMTSSGQLGTIVSVDGDAVVIETTPGVLTRWVKAAIQEVPAQFASVLQPADDSTVIEGVEPVGTTDATDSIDVTVDDPRDDRTA